MNNEDIKKQLDAISNALIYLIESMPNHEYYSDYGIPEGAAKVNDLKRAMGENVQEF